MLIHKNITNKKPKRVIILGAGGFISQSVENRLNKLSLKVLPYSRKKIDLLKRNSQNKLSRILKPNDTLIFCAAKAPVKNEKMLIENLIMCQNLCEILKNKPVSHLIYLSSDAVYADSSFKLSEKSIAEPTSLHGAMHLTREIMISQLYKIDKCFVRPTLVFGYNDPHDGYGPNKFIRLSTTNEPIILFGKGEEKRDHVWVEDVSKIISLICIKKVLVRSILHLEKSFHLIK